VLVASHGAYLTTLLAILRSFPWLVLSPDVEATLPCLNTSVMKVQLRRRADVTGLHDGSRQAQLYKDALAQVERAEAEAAARTRPGAPKAMSDWVGAILSWADVTHLEVKDQWEDPGLADDMGDTGRR
jgi:hypothetical protein